MPSRLLRWSYRNIFDLVLLIGVLTSPDVVLAHAPGENYVWVNVESDHIAGRFEIHLKDLNRKLGIDWQEHGATRIEAVAATATQVQDYLREHFEIVFDGNPLELQFEKTNVFKEKSNYAQYFYHTETMTIPDSFVIRNDIFISPDDPLHRSLIVLEYNKNLDKEYGGENAIMAFGPHKSEQLLDLNDLPALLQPLDFIWQGCLHIWIGIDHVLFLLALLLLAVMDRVEGQWQPVPTFKKAIWNVLKIVTLFTIAHSVTLSLAAFNIVNLNSRIVESLIALSIVLVGINNIFPKFNDKAWLIIFFFGLFHGMGFASVMGELPFRTVSLMKILLSFNAGVELGQLAIVVGIFPVIFFLRKTKIYRPVVVVGGSLVICVIAFYWFVERALAL